MAEIPPSYTHYPRPNYQTAPYSRPPGVYIETIGDAVKMVQADLGVWILATILGGIAGAFIYALLFGLQFMVIYGGNLDSMAKPEASIGAVLLVQLESMLVTLPPATLLYMLFFGLANMAVRKAQGHTLAATDIFLPFKRFGSVYLTLLLSTILWYAGMIALIVPGIFLTGALSLAPLIAQNQGVGPIEAIKRSIQTLGGQAWMMFLVLLIGYMVWSVGFIACLVGALFSTPVYAAVVGLHYHYFFPPEAAAYVPTADVPSSY